jgi:hypothetical protein
MDMRICSECGHEYDALQPHECYYSIADVLREKATHGGPRNGAGRKPLGDAVRVTAVLTPDLVAKADELGNGNTSEGIRKALKGQGTMNSKPTMKRIANSKALWNEYVDPQRNDPELFDSLTVEQRINIQRELWPDEYDEELRTLAIEIAGIVLDGDDKNERDAIEGEIYDWLADGETITQDADALAVEWEIYEADAADALA